MSEKKRFETRAIELTHKSNSNTNPVSTPIYLSSTYKRNEDGSYNDELIYARHNNPNREQLEKAIAHLENGAHGFAFSSGMAAISTVLQTLKSGDHILIPDDVYYAVRKLLADVCSGWGIQFDLVDMTNLKLVKKAIKPETALIWMESPSNPLLKITDIQAVVEICKSHGILSCVDNTWATPVLQNPLNFGVDIVMHSSSKYFGGHSDVIGGALVANDSILSEKIKAVQTLSGAVQAPFDSWLISRGVKTLALRIEKQSSNAYLLAKFLESHPKVAAVLYPGLESHPQHEIVLKQYNGIHYGGMISVLVDGGVSEAVAVSNKLELFTTATSLGGVESLIEHRKSVEGPDSKTPENLLRVSVGIEHIDDLINDWKQALDSLVV